MHDGRRGHGLRDPELRRRELKRRLGQPVLPWVPCVASGCYVVVMSVRAKVLRVDGSTVAEVFDGEEPPRAWLKEQVGGYIEIVKVGERTVIVNEDALMRGLAKNEHVAEVLGDVSGSVDGYLRGDVVVVEPVH